VLVFFQVLNLAGNISSFIKNLKKRIEKINYGQKVFPNLHYIVTDDSKASHQSLKNHFPRNVQIVKCLWHKRLNFEANLDKVGVDILVKCMWDKNPLKCVS
jgi:hypothetical protein